MKKVILISLFLAFTCPTYPFTPSNSIKNTLWATACIVGAAITALSSAYIFKRAKPVMMRSYAGFYISRLYNRIMYGASFTFNQIAGALKHEDIGNIYVKYDDKGNINAINDGKKTPLLLGSIPCENEHIKQLQNKYGNNQQIGIYTLNEKWECDAAGLSKLVANNNNIQQFHYTTPDFDAPSLIDLIRAVRDLNVRDSNNQLVSLVHCKAGRGRSATVIAAYLATIVHAAGHVATVQQLEDYLLKHRPQVDMNDRQKIVLNDFITQLKDAQGFQNLCEKYTNDLLKRDQEIMRSITPAEIVL